jgi:hypothetical protein
VFRVDGRWMVGNSSITRRRPPTDSDRETTGKVRFARNSPRAKLAPLLVYRAQRTPFAGWVEHL